MRENFQKLRDAGNADIILSLAGLGKPLRDPQGNEIFSNELRCHGQEPLRLGLVEKSDAAKALKAYGELIDMARKQEAPQYADSLMSPLVPICNKAVNAKRRGR